MIVANHRNMRLSLIVLTILLSWQFALSQETSVKWFTLEEATALAEKNPKKIFIDVSTTWCGWCKKMDKEVFSQDFIIEALNKYYYPVKLDAQQKEPIQYKGKTFKYRMYNQKGFNEFAVELLRGRMGFPSLVFLDEDFQIVQALEGYQQAYRLSLILEYIGTDEHKKTPWDTYVRKIQANDQSLQFARGN